MCHRLVASSRVLFKVPRAPFAQNSITNSLHRSLRTRYPSNRRCGFGPPHGPSRGALGPLRGGHQSACSQQKYTITLIHTLSTHVCASPQTPRGTDPLECRSRLLALPSLPLSYPLLSSVSSSSHTSPPPRLSSSQTFWMPPKFSCSHLNASLRC